MSNPKQVVTFGFREADHVNPRCHEVRVNGEPIGIMTRESGDHRGWSQTYVFTPDDVDGPYAGHNGFETRTLRTMKEYLAMGMLEDA